LREETFYSLGHDAIGLALQEWRVRESEARRRREAERAVRNRTRFSFVASVTAVIAVVGVFLGRQVAHAQQQAQRVDALAAAADRVSRSDMNLALVAAIEAAVTAESIRPLYAAPHVDAREKLAQLLMQLPRIVVTSPYVRDSSTTVLNGS